MVQLLNIHMCVSGVCINMKQANLLNLEVLEIILLYSMFNHFAFTGTYNIQFVSMQCTCA